MPFALTSTVLLLGGGSIGMETLFATGDCEGNVLILCGNLGAKLSSLVLTGDSERRVDGFLGTGGAALRLILLSDGRGGSGGSSIGSSRRLC